MTDLTVRYIVNDVEEAVDFYSESLDFDVVRHPAPHFASLSRGALTLHLNQQRAGGGGTAGGLDLAPVQPGGWNRIQIEVDDLDDTVTRLKEEGCKFQSEIVEGEGGDQALVRDPSGNLVELFEPHAGP